MLNVYCVYCDVHVHRISHHNAVFAFSSLNLLDDYRIDGQLTKLRQVVSYIHSGKGDIFTCAVKRKLHGSSCLVASS